MTSAAAEKSSELTHVNSFIRYSGRDAEGGFIRANGDYSFSMEDHPAIVRNARLEKIDFATHGFTLVKHRTEANFDDPADIERRYYPEACRIVKELTGASEVFAFLGIRRGGESNAGGGPALSAHVDFNEAALRGWVARLAPDRAETLLRKRLVNINLWRPLRPVENYPLAVCDARSVDKSDFMTVRFGEGGQTASLAETAGGLNVAFNPKHRWYYYPNMQPDEILVFRLFDTGDPEWHMTAHTAFEDPTSRPGSPPRESFELRTVAIFD
ncbi:MAG: CmcJ/NvfI family oxidoreductase [Pseudomonadota bacterium]